MVPLDRSGDGVEQVGPRARCARAPLQRRAGTLPRGRAGWSLCVGDPEPGERPVDPREGCPFCGHRIASSGALEGGGRVCALRSRLSAPRATGPRGMTPSTRFSAPERPSKPDPVRIKNFSGSGLGRFWLSGA